LFSLSLDPDGSSFWTADVNTGVVAKVDIASGNVVSSFAAYAPNGLFGLEVAGGTGPAPSFKFAPTFGNLFNGIIARLHPTGGPGNIGQETATVAWGDGSVTSAALSIPASDPSELDVSGSHTYWTPGSVPVVVKLTDTQTGAVQTFSGSATVSSHYVAMGDSYSSGEGAGWPPQNAHPNLPGCDFQPSSGGLYEGGTDHINGAHIGLIAPLYGSGCITPPPPLTGDVCHRAITAYGHVVQRLLASVGIKLTFVACSGAEVNNAYLSGNAVFGDQKHSGEAPQVGALRSGVSLITLSMGGNNVGFADMAKNCVVSSFFSQTANCVSQDNLLLSRLGYDTRSLKPTDGDFHPPRLQSQINPGSRPLSQLVTYSDHLTGQSCAQNKTQCLPTASFGPDLHDALVLLYRKLKNAAPGARILVLGYPHFFPNGGTGSTCDEHFSQFDQTWVNDRISTLDSIIGDAASESGVAQYVDVYNALAGHEECTGKPNWFVDPTTGLVAPCTGAWINGVDVAASLLGTPEVLHPNPCGHQQEGKQVAAAYGSPPSPLDQFGLGSGATHGTTVNVTPGTRRETITLQWTSDRLGYSLTDPSGTVVLPVQTGPTYAVWTVWNPSPGSWTLTSTNPTTGELGAAQARVSATTDSIPSLPPAGEAIMLSESCNIFFRTCTATLGGFVSRAISGRVAQFQWFDHDGGFLGNGNTITVSGGTPFNVILKTIGAGSYADQHRLTSFTVTCAVAGC
jgi:hypothetical protein